MFNGGYLQHNGLLKVDAFAWVSGGQDIEDWAVPNNADYIALSFVQKLGLRQGLGLQKTKLKDLALGVAFGRVWPESRGALPRSADDVKDCRKHCGGKDIKAGAQGRANWCGS